MLQQRHRERSNRQQRLMLALGCGSSVVIHLGLIAGIASWWRSPAPVDEPLDITLVELTEIEPVTVAPSPPSVQPPKISSIARPQSQFAPKPTVLKPVSKPIVATPAPKSVAVAVKPISQPMRSTTRSKPRSSSIKPKVKPNPRPIQAAKVNSQPAPIPFPIDPKTPTPNPVRASIIDPPIAPKPASKPIQSQPKPIPNSITNPPFNLPIPQPLKTTPPPTLANSAPPPVKPNPLVSKSPEDTTIPPTTSPPAPAGDNIPDRDRQSIPSQNRPAGGSLTANEKNRGRSQEGSLQAPNSSTSGAVNKNARSAKADATRTNGRSSGVGSSASGGNFSSNSSQTSSNDGDGSGSSSSSGGSGLQCVQNCEIPKLRDLQDRDGGKDRLRIRIVVDPNGLVLAATISKSSDNPQIDATVLEGIKQMQFRPPGKVLKGIIKANIIL